MCRCLCTLAKHQQPYWNPNACDTRSSTRIYPVYSSLLIGRVGPIATKFTTAKRASTLSTSSNELTASSTHCIQSSLQQAAPTANLSTHTFSLRNTNVTIVIISATINDSDGHNGFGILLCTTTCFVLVYFGSYSICAGYSWSNSHSWGSALVHGRNLHYVTLMWLSLSPWAHLSPHNSHHRVGTHHWWYSPPHHGVSIFHHLFFVLEIPSSS